MGTDLMTGCTKWKMLFACGNKINMPPFGQTQWGFKIQQMGGLVLCTIPGSTSVEYSSAPLLSSLHSTHPAYCETVVKQAVHLIIMLSCEHAHKYISIHLPAGTTYYRY